MVVIIGRAFLKGQRFIHTGAVRVPGLERAVGGAFDHNIFIVVNILCDGPLDILLDSSAEGIVGVGDGCGTLGDLSQPVFIVISLGGDDAAFCFSDPVAV